MSELLERVRGEIRARRNELRAAVDEHERLEAAQAALRAVTGGVSQPRPAADRPPIASAPRRARRTGSVRAPRGANRAAVLRAVTERPGASAGELAAASGVSRPVVYNLLKSLTERGELVRRELPRGVAGYAPAPEPSAFASAD
jgi:DNA-binding transcriptional ArsR family regulator